MLHNITIVINFLALLVALWLGLFLVTRGSHRPEAWLSALALWSMGGYFLNQLLALNPPPAPPPEIRTWLYHLMLFWPRDVFEMGWKGWLLGWLPAYSLIFWYHATLYMLPGPFTRNRLFGAWLGYVVTLAGILVKIHYRYTWFSLIGDPLYNSSLTYPFFPLFVIGFVTFAGLSVLNLARTARSSPASMPHGQFWLFNFAILLVGATGMLGIVSTLLNTPIPQGLTALFLLAALLLAGIGVARYNALIDLRSMPRDFFNSAAGATIVLAIYLFFLRNFTRLYPLPAISYIFVGCLAVITHFLIDVARLQLGRLYFNKESRKLRLRLHELYDPDKGKDSGEVLGMALETLASVVKVAWALVLCESTQGVRLLASWNWKDIPLGEAASSLEISSLPANSLVVLKPQQLSPPLDQAAVVVPLSNQEQATLLLVGPSRGQDYSKAELGMIQNVGKFMTGMILGRSSGIESLATHEDGPSPEFFEQPARTVDISVQTVELALRNLHNYAYLADSPLSKLCLVVQRLENLKIETDTHIDRGRAVSEVLSEAVLKLRPSQEDMPKPPPRTWFPYIILWDAYLENKPNQEIMSRLYISEGTFNRTRKTAICSVARLLMEMEDHSG